MREIRLSGLEGGARFNPSSLPLLARKAPPPTPIVFQRHGDTARAYATKRYRRAAEKQGSFWLRGFYKQAAASGANAQTPTSVMGFMAPG